MLARYSVFGLLLLLVTGSPVRPAPETGLAVTPGNHLALPHPTQPVLECRVESDLAWVDTPPFGWSIGDHGAHSGSVYHAGAVVGTWESTAAAVKIKSNGLPVIAGTLTLQVAEGQLTVSLGDAWRGGNLKPRSATGTGSFAGTRTALVWGDDDSFYVLTARP